MRENSQTTLSGFELKKRLGRVHPLERVSLLNQFLFVWVGPIINRCLKKPWEQEMNFRLPEIDQILDHSKRFYDRVVMRRKGVLFSLIWGTKKMFFLLILLSFLLNIMSYGSSYFLAKLINSLQEGSRFDNTDTLIYISNQLLCIVLLTISSGMISSWIGFETWRMALVWRSNMMTCVFEKMLSYNSLNPSPHSEGNMMNYLQVDAGKFELAGYAVVGLSQTIFGLLISTLLGLYFIGYPVLLMLSFMLIMNVLLFYIYNIEMRLNKGIMKAKDERVNFMKNILNNIKFIKTRAWENLYHFRLYQKRSKELAGIRIWGFVVAFEVFLNWVNPTLAVSAIFIYKIYLSDTPMDISNFSGFLKVFSDLRVVLIVFPWYVSKMIEIYVSVGRIREFVWSPELESYMKEKPAIACADDSSIIVENGFFAWNTKLSNDQIEELTKQVKLIKKSRSSNNQRGSHKGIPDSSSMTQTLISGQDAPSSKLAEISQGVGVLGSYSFRLKEINLKIKKNKMTCIIGRLGSGKSSLLYALAGEMKLDDNIGEVNTKITRYGRTMLLSQKPWIISDTIEKNITIDGEVDQYMLEEAIQLAQFDEDLKIMPDGINSMIGESGQNLSGGQRTRLCLARCIYQRPDIYLLDDPLSALDMHVADRIMENTFGKHLSTSTRVMVTNAIQHLKYADDIVLIDEGRILFQGTFEEIQSHPIYVEIKQVSKVK